MSRFPRGSLPSSSFPALATVAPYAIVKSQPSAVTPPPAPACDLTTTCPTCIVEMLPEHAHYKCPSCGYRDSSSF